MISSIPLTRRRPHARGFVLLEVLVALLIFAFGVLGVVGLQAALTRAQTDGKFRGEAALLAQEMIGTMWTDIPNINSYGDGDTAACAAQARCKAMQDKVAATLPNGTLTITRAGLGLVTITIGWTPSSADPHTYTTSTAVRT